MGLAAGINFSMRSVLITGTTFMAGISNARSRQMSCCRCLAARAGAVSMKPATALSAPQTRACMMDARASSGVLGG
jgi:hypothetical protein